MTLIDKAEALAPCPFCGGAPKLKLGRGAWGVLCTCGGKAFVHTYEGGFVSTGKTTEEAKASAIAAWNRRAIPARGVGVPADVKDYAINVSEAYDTMMEVQRNPAGAWQVIQALAGHIAALAPTDAAQAREAVFLGVCECGMTGPCMWDQCKHPLTREARP